MLSWQRDRILRQQAAGPELGSQALGDKLVQVALARVLSPNELDAARFQHNQHGDARFELCHIELKLDIDDLTDPDAPKFHGRTDA